MALPKPVEERVSTIEGELKDLEEAVAVLTDGKLEKRDAYAAIEVVQSLSVIGVSASGIAYFALQTAQQFGLF